MPKEQKHKGDGDTNHNLRTRKGPQKVGKGAGGIGNWRTNRDHPNYSIAKIGQNSEKCPEDLRRFSVTYTQ